MVKEEEGRVVTLRRWRVRRARPRPPPAPLPFSLQFCSGKDDQSVNLVLTEVPSVLYMYAQKPEQYKSERRGGRGERERHKKIEIGV